MQRTFFATGSSRSISSSTSCAFPDNADLLRHHSQKSIPFNVERDVERPSLFWFCFFCFCFSVLSAYRFGGLSEREKEFKGGLQGFWSFWCQKCQRRIHI